MKHNIEPGMYNSSKCASILIFHRQRWQWVKEFEGRQFQAIYSLFSFCVPRLHKDYSICVGHTGLGKHNKKLNTITLLPAFIIFSLFSTTHLPYFSKTDVEQNVSSA